MYRITIELDTDDNEEATEVAKYLFENLQHFNDYDYMVSQPELLEVGQEHPEWKLAESA